jgi:hypothetical protein
VIFPLAPLPDTLFALDLPRNVFEGNEDNLFVDPPVPYHDWGEAAARNREETDLLDPSFWLYSDGWQ